MGLAKRLTGQARCHSCSAPSLIHIPGFGFPHPFPVDPPCHPPLQGCAGTEFSRQAEEKPVESYFQIHGGKSDEGPGNHSSSPTGAPGQKPACAAGDPFLASVCTQRPGQVAGHVSVSFLHLRMGRQLPLSHPMGLSRGKKEPADAT